MGLFEGISDVPGVSDDALCSLGGAVIAKLHTLPFRGHSVNCASARRITEGSATGSESSNHGNWEGG